MTTFDYIGEVLAGKRALPEIKVGFSTTSIITLCTAIIITSAIILLLKKAI